MKMRSKGGVMVLAVLMVDFSGQFSALHACAHGASGKEQVGYREGNDRIEAVIVGDFASKKIVKLFVGPPSEKVFGSIKDYESVKKKLKPLADRAAWLAEQGESSMSLRGGPGSVDLGGGVAALPRSFVGDQLDWDKIKSELALPDSPNDDEFRKWVGKIKRYDRGLHALIIDSKNLAGKETTSLAAKIKYEGGSSASNMLLDKYLESGGVYNTPTAFWMGEGTRNASLKKMLQEIAGADSSNTGGIPGMGNLIQFKPAKEGDSVRPGRWYQNINFNIVRITKLAKMDLADESKDSAQEGLIFFCQNHQPYPRSSRGEEPCRVD